MFITMKFIQNSRLRTTFKLLILSSFLFSIFLCLQCVNEKIVAQKMAKASPVAEKQVVKGPSLKTETSNAGMSETVTIFPATLSIIPVEKNPDTFSPNLFSNVVYPTSFNRDLGFYLPNWIVTLQTTLSKVYIEQKIPLRNRGVWGSVDWIEHSKEGSDWNFTVDPENGRFFPNNYNTRKSVNMNTFSSALPIEKRIQSATVDLNNWDTKTEADLAEMGKNAARATQFGDYNLPGKQRIGLVNMDWENNYENGSNPRKSLRFIKSVCDNLQGIFQAMYVHPINAEVGNLTQNGYPNTNGEVNQSSINPIYTSIQNLDGVDYRVTDSKNFAPLLEISHYGETSMHGYNDGVRTLNAYGRNANIEHYLARVVSMAEKNYYYLHSIGKDLAFIQSKMICDRGANGWQYADGSRKGGGNKDRFSKYLTRDQVFKTIMSVFFSGLNYHEWNRPVPNMNADCYNGFQFALNLLGTRKIMSNNENVSAVDMRTSQAEFHLWKSKYKFAGETAYRQEKGYELKDNTDNLLVRTMRMGNKLAILVVNPYNVATKFNLTVACQNGERNFEKSFSASDWQSCYPNDARRDYIFDIIEMK